MERFLLSKSELHRIHEASLDILEKMGVKVRSDKGIKILEEAGASIDAKTKYVKIPRELVENALRRTPKVCRLCGRDPKFDMILDGEHMYLGIHVGSTTIIDLDTGERRSSTKDDVIKTAILVDALEDINFFSTIHPMDKLYASWLHAYDAAVDNTVKHVRLEPPYAIEIDYLARMAATVLGDEETLRKRPIFSVVECTVSPLILEELQTDAGLEAAKFGIPIHIMPMPIIGATVPITLAGALALSNAQFLSFLTVIQLAYPGTPIIYAWDPSVIDMRTGGAGSSLPDAIRLGMYGIQLARYYGVPSYTPQPTTSAKFPDIQSGYEKALGALSLSLVKPDLFACGCIEDFLTFSFEQLLIDVEIFRAVRRICSKMLIDDDALAMDVILKVGPEGHFLAQEHTRRHLKKDYLFPILTDVTSFKAWKERGGKTIVEVAREKVKKIIASHEPKHLDRDIKSRLDEIIKEAEMKKIPIGK
jgi:trimethylamine--corrinoid protein Co-methyltransferase